MSHHKKSKPSGKSCARKKSAKAKSVAGSALSQKRPRNNERPRPPRCKKK